MMARHISGITDLALKLFLLSCSLLLISNRSVWGQAGCTEEEIRAKIEQYEEGAVIECGLKSVDSLIAVLKQNDADLLRRQRAAYVLGQIGAEIKLDSNEAFVSTLIDILQQNDADPRLRRAAVDALGNAWMSSIKIVDALIAVLQQNDINLNVHVGVVSNLEKIGKKLNKRKDEISPEELNQFISTFEEAVKAIEENNHISDSESVAHYLNELKQELKELKQEQQFRWQGQIIKWLGRGWLFQVGFWVVLIFFYPNSSQVQAIFFWNPKIRKIMGLWYVDLALTWIPFLRYKLFIPFKESLLSDAYLDTFDPHTYFADSYVEFQGSIDTKPIRETIPEIKGQVVLVGESGLGKSMFLRNLVKCSQRIVVYLPAQKCAQGVIEAIQAKLHGKVEDVNFLKSLIYSGAIDICIDGLNEVTPDTRAIITDFVGRYFKGNIIMTTQPLEQTQWHPPATVRIGILKPLELDQIEQFLISRQAVLPLDASVKGADYEQAVKDYLTTIFSQQCSEEEQKAIYRMVSNPMELTIVAQMLARGEKPNLLNLQQQQYEIMAADYNRLYPSTTFPLKAFSETVYQMRLKEESSIPPEEWLQELQCMERYKMIFNRQSVDFENNPTKSWHFRHDKIQDFFIVQTFLGEQKDDRLENYISDSRFRGVYFLLATTLPADDAKKLREILIQYAADTKDHTVSDTFIQLMRAR